MGIADLDAFGEVLAELGFEGSPTAVPGERHYRHFEAVDAGCRILSVRASVGGLFMLTELRTFGGESVPVWTDVGGELVRAVMAVPARLSDDVAAANRAAWQAERAESLRLADVPDAEIEPATEARVRGRPKV